MKYVCDFSSDGIVLADIDSGEKTSYTVESFYNKFYAFDYSQEGIDMSELIFGAYFENDSKPIFEPLSYEQSLKCAEMMNKIRLDQVRQRLIRGANFVVKPFTDKDVALFRAGLGTDCYIPKYATILCDSCFFNSKLPDKLVIPDNIRTLSPSCFLGTYANEIQCPASLETIDAGIFYMANISSFIFPEKVEYLSTEVFSGLSDKTTFYVPEQLYVKNKSIFDTLYRGQNPVNII